MTGMHLAELNVGRFRYPADDPRMAGFMRNLDLINGIADRSPGFVWRMQDESGNATGIEVTADPMMAANLSVWEDAESFGNYVWNTVHRRFYEQRDRWFEVMASMHFVMWWVAPGSRPTLAEAMGRLDHLTLHGDSDHAFGWDHLGGAARWQERRCAHLAAE